MEVSGEGACACGVLEAQRLGLNVWGLNQGEEEGSFTLGDGAYPGGTQAHRAWHTGCSIQLSFQCFMSCMSCPAVQPWPTLIPPQTHANALPADDTSEVDICIGGPPGYHKPSAYPVTNKFDPALMALDPPGLLKDPPQLRAQHYHHHR